MDWLYSLIKSKFISEILSFIFYGSGIFAFLKLSIWIYSQKMFSFYWIYKHRNKFETHRVFDLIDSIQSYKKDVATGVLDPIKKEILEELFSIEITKIKKILSSNLKQIFKNNLKEYIHSFFKFDMDRIIHLFYYEYMEKRDSVESLARLRLTKLGMTHEDFNKLWSLYEEICTDYHIVLFETLNKYRSHKDIYRAMFFILDDYAMIIEIMYKSIAHKFNRLNGRSYGIKFKGGSIGDYGK